MGIGLLLARITAIGIGMLRLCLLGAFLNGDGKSRAGNLLSIDSTTGTTYIERAFHIGLENVGKAKGRRTAGFSIDDRHTGTLRGHGTGEYRKSFERGATEVGSAVVDFVADFETAAQINPAGGPHGKLLRGGIERQN